MGRDFSSSVQTHYWANPTSITMCAVCFPAGKRVGCGAEHPPHQSPKLKRIGKLLPHVLNPHGLFYSELYIYRSLTNNYFGNLLSSAVTFKLYCLKLIYNLNVNGYCTYHQFYHSTFCVLYSLFSKASCSTLAWCSKIGDGSSVVSYDCQCRLKLLQNAGNLLTTQR